MAAEGALNLPVVTEEDDAGAVRPYTASAYARRPPSAAQLAADLPDSPDLSQLQRRREARSASATASRAATLTDKSKGLENTLRADGTEIGLGEMTKGDILSQLFFPETQARYGMSPMHVAAGTGDINLVNETIRQYQMGVSVDQRDRLQRTPCFIAVVANIPAVLEALLRAGADPCAQDVDGRTPAHWAAFHGRVKLLQILVSAATFSPTPGEGVTPTTILSTKDKEGRIPLHWAASNKQTKGLELLIKEMTTHRLSLDAEDQERMTVLHWSCLNAQPKHVALLIKAGISVGARDIEGKSALHWCTSSDDAGCAKTLLAADKTLAFATDNDGRTALHIASGDDNQELVKAITKAVGKAPPLPPNSRTPLHYACASGSVVSLTCLLKAGWDAKITDKNGAAAMHYAAQHNKGKCIEALLKASSENDVPDSEGRSALSWAVIKGHLEACQALIACKVNINAQDSFGRTALHAATFAGNRPIVELLLKSGASLHVEDKAKQTPIFAACEHGHVEIAQVLIERAGSEILRVLNVQDGEGRRPLHWAAIGGHDQILEAISRIKGINLNAPDGRGETALHYSAFFGHSTCCRLLLSSAADPNLQDAEGFCPLHWACSQGHADIAEQLIRYEAYPNYMESSQTKFTPLDYAINAQHEGIAQLLIDHGALGIEGIQFLAVLRVQAAFRGFRARKRVRAMKFAQEKRENDAAVVIQANARRFMQQKKYRTMVEEQKQRKRTEEEQKLEEQRKREDEERMKAREETRAKLRAAEEEERKRREEDEARRQEEDRKRKEEEAKRKEREEEELRARSIEQELKRKEEEEKRRRLEDIRREEERRVLEEEKQRLRIEQEQKFAEQATQVLREREVRAFVVRKEKDRLQQMRAAIAAARTIQRWFRQVLSRRYRAMGRAPPPKHSATGPAPVSFPPSKRAPAPQAQQPPKATGHAVSGAQAQQAQHEAPQQKRVTPQPQSTVEKRKRIVAALTIQLWWRRILANKHRRNYERAAKAHASRSTAIQSVRVKGIYGSIPKDLVEYKPKPTAHQSHLAYRGPSPASLSLASAASQFHEASPAAGMSAQSKQQSLGRRKSVGGGSSGAAGAPPRKSSTSSPAVPASLPPIPRRGTTQSPRGLRGSSHAVLPSIQS